MRTLSEAAEVLRRNGAPPTPDDVTLLDDGRRIRTADDLRAVIAEFKASHASKAQQRERADEPIH